MGKTLKQMVLGKLDSHMQKSKTVPFPYTIHKSKLKMKDLSVRQEPIKILEENTGSNFFNLSCSNFLLDTSPKARETKAKMNYSDFIKLKSFSTAKPKDTEWEKVFANNTIR